MTLSRTALAGILLALSTTSAAAQSVLDVPQGPLVPGSTVTITLSDPSRPNDTVVITIDGTTTKGPAQATLVIHTDASGKGSANWVVPGWLGAFFSEPGGAEEYRPIDS
ncbi:MAG: hypothetical protein AB7O97_05355 [Planctomycetota bacterium]